MCWGSAPPAWYHEAPARSPLAGASPSFRATPMRDLLLYRLLRATPLDADAVLPLLRELPSLPVQERAAFLGYLRTALTHADPEIRRAAAAALAGASGHSAWVGITDALRDPEEAVRLAALEALRESCRHDGPRWIHALFHRDPAVRRAAIDPARPSPLQWQAKLYLLPDEECRPALKAELDKHGADKDVVALLVGYMRDGAFTPEDVRRWTRDLRWNAWLGYLAPLLPRTDDPTPLLDDAMKPDFPSRVPPLEADRLTDLLALFWDVADAPFFTLLSNAALSEAPAFRGWLAYRLLLHGLHAGRWPAQALDLACVLWPFALACDWLPEVMRREALAAFYEAADRCPRFDAARIKPLLVLPVVRYTGEALLDPWAAGAVLHAVEGKPYELLKDIPEEELAEGFRRDFARAVNLLRVPERGSQGRLAFVEMITKRAGADAPRMLALLAATVPADQLDFLDGFSLRTMQEVHEALLAIEASGKALTDNKVVRLAGKIASRFAPEAITAFLTAWLTSPVPESPLSIAVLGRFFHEGHAEATVKDLAALAAPALATFVRLLPGIPGIPYERETELAHLLRGHPDPGVSAWAVARTTPKAEEPSETPQVRTGVIAHIAAVASPSVPACVSLLSSGDAMDEVVAAFARCSSPDPAFVQALDLEMVRLWRGNMALPFLGHAWLYRWDQHLSHLSRQFAPGGSAPAGQGMAAFLRWATGLSAPALADRLWLVGARLLDHWRWHDAPRHAATLDARLGAALVEALPGRHGDTALTLLLGWKDRCPPSALGALEGVRQKLALILGELPQAIRERLAGWVGDFTAPVTQGAAPVEEEKLSLSPEALEKAAAGLDDRKAIPAARQLLGMGRPGAERLARAIASNHAVTWPLALLPLLPGADASVRKALEALVRSPLGDPQTRFRVGRALWATPDVDDVEHLIAAVCAGSPPGWLNGDDTGWLTANYAGPEDELALRLITSPHPAAHGRAVHRLAGDNPLPPASRAALLAFLEVGTTRLRAFRVQAAAALHAAGERDSVLPVLIGERPGDQVRFPTLLGGQGGEALDGVVRGVLAVGGEPLERLLLALLDNGHDIVPAGWTQTAAHATPSRVDGTARQEALAVMLDQVRSATVRQEVRRRLAPGLGRTRKLRNLARTFAWGVRLGRQLTGELFDLEMIAGEELGYTRFDQLKLFISPLPILRGEQDGREVVKGLILHEYGHHLYHKGPGDKDVWARAQKEKMHPLLNLVSDEHLERNLRSKDEEYGNLIKTLDAYAFQHAAREIDVSGLLSSLGSRAFHVLTSLTLHAGRGAGTVRVSAGGLLHQMDRAGLSFARFMRALRMGLGNRHGDEKVGRGLELFKGAAFRSSTMPRMYEIAKELRRIFGEETEILNCVGQDGTMCGTGEEVIVLGDGITNDELQRAIQRALEDPTDQEPEKGSPVRTINRGTNLDFPLIDLVQPKAFDPRKYAKYARRVSRQARRLREVLLSLGLALEPRPMRVRGKSLDRSRLLPLVIKNDPRVLTARETVFRTDLFLGVLIDCSGSMSMGENIEKAKLFAALLAEAARGLRGIDVRFWGFTDRRIHDCGDATRPAIHDLAASEGNNDSAALYHASLEAKASRRRAKLLVMISDGSPTECTVESLRNLVRRLTGRQGYLCAQVAVRPLDDVCFPHYVLLEEGRVDEAVKKFGQVILRLVRQALGV